MAIKGNKDEKRNKYHNIQKDLSDEDEVKVKMPAEVADDVKDGDMLVVREE